MKKFLVVTLQSEVDIDETVNIAFVTLNSKFQQAYSNAIAWMEHNDALSPKQITFDAITLCESISATYVIGNTNEWSQLTSAKNQNEAECIINDIDDGSKLASSGFSSSLIIYKDGTIRFEMLPDNTVDIALCYSDFLNIEE